MSPIPVESTSAESSTSTHSALADFAWLMGSGVVFAALLAGPAWWLAGPDGLTGLAVSAALCLIPGILTVLLRVVIADSASLLLAANGLRLAFVMTGAFVGRLFVTGDGLKEFFVWLIAFYLFTLAVETCLAFRRDVAAS